MAGWTERDWPAIDALLDAVLDQPAERRLAWIEAQGGEARIKQAVRELLAADARFLDRVDAETGPRFGDAIEALVSPVPPAPEIPGYEILGLLGEGGFGVVYEARQLHPVRRRVALKVIKPGMDTHQVIARFEAERQALAWMDHPHIAHVYDAGTTASGRPFFVMERVYGEPINSFCRTRNLSIAARLALFAQVCAAVQHAHDKGVLHRDLKPNNVLVSEHDGEPFARIIDFGIAKVTHGRLTDHTLLTDQNLMMGTPLYMSTEQAEGRVDIDARADVYGLGAILYELLTDATPLDRDSLRGVGRDELLRIIRDVEPVLPSRRVMQLARSRTNEDGRRLMNARRWSGHLRGDLDRIAMKALEKDRARRYATASDLAADLRRHRNGEPVLASPRGLSYRLRKGAYRHRGALAILALLVAVGATTFVVGSRHAQLAHPVTGSPPADSIAVLPFVNENAASGERYVSDGLAVSLITALSQFAGLRVINRNSAFQFRDSPESDQSIGEKLGVAHLLKGSVRRAGASVRVTATLIDAVDGSVVWSRHYDRRDEDLFAMQDAIALDVAHVFRAKLQTPPGAVVQTARPPSGKLEAWNAYQQGTAFFVLRTEPGTRKAIEAFTQATRLDPHYAAAFAQLSRARSFLASHFLGGEQAAAVNAEARQAADTALQLDPQSALAHLALATILRWVEMDWEGSVVEARRAWQLAPNDPIARYAYGGVLASLGKTRQSVALVSEALQSDPRNANWYRWHAFYLAGMGRLDEAREAVLTARSLQPAATGFAAQLAIVEILDGNADAALVAARQEPAGLWRAIAETLALQVGADRTVADTALEKLVADHGQQVSYQIAQAYALRRDPDNLFQWLDAAWAHRDSGISMLLSDPLILRYRHDPRFAAFCRKAGLPMTTDAVAME